jgi:ABC-type multidrug transport system fused ATPase/permease subunit
MAQSISHTDERKTGKSGFGSLQTLSHNPWAVAGLWALGLAGVGLSLVLPNQVGRLTTIFGLAQRVTWQPVLWAVAYLIAAQLGLSVVMFLRTRIDVSLRESVSRMLTLVLFGRILRFSADFFRDQEVERINSRALEDTNRVANFRVSALVGMPLAAASIVIFGVIMILDNYFLGLCMVALSVLSGYLLAFDRQIQAVNRQARETWDGIRVSANEVIGGVSEYRNHCAYDYGLKGLGKSFEKYHGVMLRVGRLMAMFGAIDPVVVTIQTGVLFWVGAALCIPGSPLAGFAGQMTWGEVIKFMLLAQLFRGPVAQIAGYVLQWRMVKESTRRVDEYMKRPCVFEQRPGAPSPADDDFNVAYERVSVVTPSGIGIIKDVDLTIGLGQHVALCGPSGCGKSTLLQMLVRGVEPSSGRLSLRGRDLDQHDLLSLARQIGFVPQSPILFNTSLRNNLLLGLRRPSEARVADDEGPIDVTRLGNVRNLDDVDRELIRVVKLVGLTNDVIRKCLDSRLPDTPAANGIRARIYELRGQVARLVNESAPDMVIRFDRRRWVPGTVGENLLGPGFGAAAEASGRVFHVLEGDPVLSDLLLLGYRRFCSEHALAVRVSHDRPGLLGLLPKRRDLTEEAPLPVTCRADELVGLPDRLQESLLEIALDTDAELTGQLAASGQFERRIIETRNSRFARGDEASGPWDVARSPAYVENLTARENLLCGRPKVSMHGAAERADQLIQQVLVANGLDTEAITLGLEFRVGEGGKLLSGGQRQKVAIGRVVLKHPSLLVLDEATAGLDELSQSQIVGMVNEHFRGRTVVSISHRLASIRGHDRIVVLDRGQVAQQGTYDRLAEQEGIFRNMVHQERGEPPEAEAAWRTQEPVAAPARGEDRGELRRRIAMTSIFSNLRSDQLAFIESVMKVIRCPKDDVLFRRDDPGQELYVVLEGAVDFFIERQSGGRPETVVVNSAGPGSVFGELAMFGRGLRTVGAKVRTDATLGVLSRENLVNLINADPSIAIELLEAVSGHLARTCDAAYRDYRGN